MSIQAMEWAMGQKVGQASLKAVLLALAWGADENGGVRIQVKQFAGVLGCYDVSASRWIENLAQRGFLEKRRVGARYTSGILIQLNMKRNEKVQGEKR